MSANSNVMQSVLSPAGAGDGELSAGEYGDSHGTFDTLSSTGEGEGEGTLICATVCNDINENVANMHNINLIIIIFYLWFK